MRESGCDEVQGFYFSKPMAAGQVQGWMHEHRGVDVVLDGSDQTRDNKNDLTVSRLGIAAIAPYVVVVNAAAALA